MLSPMALGPAKSRAHRCGLLCTHRVVMSSQTWVLVTPQHNAVASTRMGFGCLGHAATPCIPPAKKAQGKTQVPITQLNSGTNTVGHKCHNQLNWERTQLP